MSATTNTLSPEEERRLNIVAESLRDELERKLNLDRFNIMVSALGGNLYECDVPSDVALPAEGLAALSNGVVNNGRRMELNAVTPDSRNLRFTVTDV